MESSAEWGNLWEPNLKHCHDGSWKRVKIGGSVFFKDEPRGGEREGRVRDRTGEKKDVMEGELFSIWLSIHRVKTTRVCGRIKYTDRELPMTLVLILRQTHHHRCCASELDYYVITSFCVHLYAPSFSCTSVSRGSSRAVLRCPVIMCRRPMTLLCKIWHGCDSVFHFYTDENKRPVLKLAQHWQHRHHGAVLFYITI